MAGAVLFDLFGTLLGPFSRVGNDLALRQCAEMVGLDAEWTGARWGESYDQRIRGEVPGIVGHLQLCLTEAGVECTPGALASAEAVYARFVEELIEPAPGAVELLEAVRVRGHSVCVLPNCHHDVARALRRGPLASLVDVWELSCETGLRKPSRRAYDRAVAALAETPTNVILVGDGSDGELEGAADAGLSAVLVRTDLSDVFDPDRPVLETWMGLAGDGLHGVHDVVLRELDLA